MFFYFDISTTADYTEDNAVLLLKSLISENESWKQIIKQREILINREFRTIYAYFVNKIENKNVERFEDVSYIADLLINVRLHIVEVYFNIFIEVQNINDDETFTDLVHDFGMRLIEQLQYYDIIVDLNLLYDNNHYGSLQSDIDLLVEYFNTYRYNMSKLDGNLTVFRDVI